MTTLWMGKGAVWTDDSDQAEDFPLSSHGRQVMEQTREVRALDQVADLLTECARLRAEVESWKILAHSTNERADSLRAELAEDRARIAELEKE